MRLRLIQFCRIIFLLLVIIPQFMLLADQIGLFPAFSLTPAWRFFLIVLNLFLVASTFLIFRYLFILPIRIISKYLDNLDILLQQNIQNKFLPIEIRSLYKKILDKAQARQTELDQYHAESIQFHSILQTMSDGILITDESGNINMLNQAAADIFRIHKDTVIGMSIAKGLRNHRLNELLMKCAATNQQQTTSIENPLDKSYIYCIAAPLDPQLTNRILFLFQDLTRVRQLEIVRRDFVSNVSHELRTPLASLKLITETLREGAIDDPPAAKRFIERMDSEVDNLTQIVEELLELSKIESGRVPLTKKWIAPLEIVQSSLERMTLQAERAGIRMQFDCSDRFPAFFVDAPRLEQVLVNLLHNAIKFTPPGGEVHLRVVQDGEEILFTIQDSGVGIPPKDLERIFERFYKADPSRSKRGTGLGLSISRHIVEAHNGKIWAESQPGQGSIFSFRIPIL